MSRVISMFSLPVNNPFFFTHKTQKKDIRLILSECLGSKN